MTHSEFYEFYEPLTDGMEMGFLFHEYKHAIAKYEITGDVSIIKKIKEIEHYMTTALPFPKANFNSHLLRSYD